MLTATVADAVDSTHLALTLARPHATANELLAAIFGLDLIILVQIARRRSRSRALVRADRQHALGVIRRRHAMRHARPAATVVRVLVLIVVA